MTEMIAKKAIKIWFFLESEQHETNVCIKIAFLSHIEKKSYAIKIQCIQNHVFIFANIVMVIN